MKQIVIPQDIRTHWLWQDCAKFKWWFDMLMSSLEPECYVHLSGNDIFRNEGQIVGTLTALAKRWNTKKDSVRYFLAKLESEQMIRMDNSKKHTLITILVLDKYVMDDSPQTDKVVVESNPEVKVVEIIEAEVVETPKKKRSKKKTPSEPTIITRARELFERIHEERSSEVVIPDDKQDNGRYYWEAKDASNMKALLKKIAYSRKTRDNPLPVDDDSLLSALESFLNVINNKWVMEHFTVPIINSQYNAIITEIKQKKNATQLSPRTSRPRTSANDVDSQKCNLVSDLAKKQSEWEAQKRKGSCPEQELLPG